MRDHEEVLGVLRATNDRLRNLAQQSIRRVLDGSADRESMEAAYAALRGDIGAAEGVEALRRGLVADGLSTSQISSIEALYLNALVGV